MTEISVDGRLIGVKDDHPAVLDARDELFEDLRSKPGLTAAEHDVAGDGGGKGAVTELIVGLSGAGSLAAFVQLVRLWLGRDRRRSLTVSITEEATGKVIRIEGEHISIESLTEALRAANGNAGVELAEGARGDS
ncbi:hypothetical protein OIA45_19740 [Streptomyces chartreusis]|uniref:effector-associated constant component EACC1 n=1 Tax=Streptomyces chartreusis TaxID=1969 RepID=UPI0038693555|nr:hypothetical protein OIA45_19740 [Streptomyces chartreusis]